MIFGITGDLARVMTFRSLYRLEARGLLACPIVGVAFDDWTLERALSIDQAGYFNCELKTKGELELAALWFVEGLGMDPLKAMTARATEEGLERIPAEWLLEECPPLEKGVIGLAWFRHLQELQPAQGSR